MDILFKLMKIFDNDKFLLSLTHGIYKYMSYCKFFWVGVKYKIYEMFSM